MPLCCTRGRAGNARVSVRCAQAGAPRGARRTSMKSKISLGSLQQSACDVWPSGQRAQSLRRASDAKQGWPRSARIEPRRAGSARPPCSAPRPAASACSARACPAARCRGRPRGSAPASTPDSCARKGGGSGAGHARERRASRASAAAYRRALHKRRALTRAEGGRRPRAPPGSCGHAPQPSGERVVALARGQLSLEGAAARARRRRTPREWAPVRSGRAATQAAPALVVQLGGASAVAARFGARQGAGVQGAAAAQRQHVFLDQLERLQVRHGGAPRHAPAQAQEAPLRF